MMTRLIGQNATIVGPSAAPIVLIVIGLISTPAHTHRSQQEFSKATRIERLSRLDDRYVEAVLLDDEHLDAGLITGLNHVIGVLQPQRHWLLNHHMFSGLGASDHMGGVQ